MPERSRGRAPAPAPAHWRARACHSLAPAGQASSVRSAGAAAAAAAAAAGFGKEVVGRGGARLIWGRLSCVFRWRLSGGGGGRGGEGATTRRDGAGRDRGSQATGQIERTGGRGKSANLSTPIISLEFSRSRVTNSRREGWRGSWEKSGRGQGGRERESRGRGGEGAPIQIGHSGL